MPSEKLTQRERRARDWQILAARRRGVPASKLAGDYGMTARAIYKIVEKWDDLPSIPKDGIPVDTGQEVRRTLVAYEQAIADLGEIVSDQDAQAHVRLGAITRVLDAHERRIKLLAAAGYVSRNLSAPLVEQEVAAVMQVVADVLRRHNVGEDVVVELITAAKRQMRSPAVLDVAVAA